MQPNPTYKIGIFIEKEDYKKKDFEEGFLK
jgi:hypothetical protein